MNDKIITREEYLKIKEELERPIDFEALIEKGALIQKGKQFYIGNMNLLPEYVSKKIKAMSKNKHGMLITFYK